MICFKEKDQLRRFETERDLEPWNPREEILRVVLNGMVPKPQITLQVQTRKNRKHPVKRVRL